MHGKKKLYLLIRSVFDDRELDVRVTKFCDYRVWSLYHLHQEFAELQEHLNWSNSTFKASSRIAHTFSR